MGFPTYYLEFDIKKLIKTANKLNTISLHQEKAFLILLCEKYVINFVFMIDILQLWSKQFNNMQAINLNNKEKLSVLFRKGNITLM